MKPIDILEDIFSSQISVQSILQPTKTYPLSKASKVCNRNNFDVCLVEDDNKDDLFVYERETRTTRPLKVNEVISESTPIAKVFELLISVNQVFIKVHYKINGVVTRADLSSIPVRIWLFGMISLFEADIRHLIHQNKIDWYSLLSLNRRKYVDDLFRKKSERNEEIDKLSCTQIVDLGTVISKNMDYYKDYFLKNSKTQLEKEFSALARLRDELAHSQKLTLDIIAIYELIQFVNYTLKKIK